MGPEKWKGELPADDAADRDRAARREGEQHQGSTAKRETGRKDIDAREDEGYDQPQSSAQKTERPEDEELGE